MAFLKNFLRNLQPQLSLPTINSLCGIKRMVTLTKRAAVPQNIQAFTIDQSPLGITAPPETIYLVDMNPKFHEVKRLPVATQDSQLLSLNIKCEVRVIDPQQVCLLSILGNHAFS